MKVPRPEWWRPRRRAAHQTSFLHLLDRKQAREAPRRCRRTGSMHKTRALHEPREPEPARTRHPAGPIPSAGRVRVRRNRLLHDVRRLGDGRVRPEPVRRPHWQGAHVGGPSSASQLDSAIGPLVQFPSSFRWKAGKRAEDPLTSIHASRALARSSRPGGK